MLNKNDFTLLRDEVRDAVLLPDLVAVRRRGQRMRGRRMAGRGLASVAVIAVIALVGTVLLSPRQDRATIASWRPPTGSPPALPAAVHGPQQGAAMPVTGLQLLGVASVDWWRTFALVRGPSGAVGIARTLDGGRSWQAWALPPAIKVTGYDFAKLPDVRPAGGQVIYLSMGLVSLISRDGGQSWADRQINDQAPIDEAPAGWPVRGSGQSSNVGAIDPAAGVLRPLRHQPGEGTPWPRNPTTDRPSADVVEAADGSLWTQASQIEQSTDAATGPSYIAVSHDRGVTWKVSRVDGAVHRLDSWDGRSGYALSYQQHGATVTASLLATNDGGDSWHQVGGPIGRPQDAAGAVALAVAPDGSLILTGAAGQGSVQRSTDGGKTFVPLTGLSHPAFSHPTAELLLAISYDPQHSQSPRFELLSSDGLHWTRGPEPPRAYRVDGQFTQLNW